MNPRPFVLVTGGAGYIGSHAVLALSAAGYGVAVIDNLATGHRWAVPPAIPFYEGDIEDEALVRRICTRHRIGAVVHFAAASLVAESMHSPLKYWHNNVGKTRALLDTLTRCGVQHFLFSSSAAVYGQPDAGLIAEDCATQPINPYGRTKLVTEQMLADLSSALPMNHGALRYFNVAGADPRGRAGQSSAIATHLIKVALEAAVGKRERIDVYGQDYDTPDGTCVRDYVHVSDLADAHVLALDRLIAQPASSFTCNIGYGRGYSVSEVLDAVDRVVGRPVTRRMAERRPGDPARLVADARAARTLLGWVPRHDDLDAMVGDALRWERALAATALARTA